MTMPSMHCTEPPPRRPVLLRPGSWALDSLPAVLSEAVGEPCRSAFMSARTAHSDWLFSPAFVGSRGRWAIAAAADPTTNQV